MKRFASTSDTFATLWSRLENLFTRTEKDIYLREKVQAVAPLPKYASPQETEAMILCLQELFARMSPDAMSGQEKTLVLVSKIHQAAFRELRSDKSNKSRMNEFDSLADLLREKAREDTL